MSNSSCDGMGWDGMCYVIDGEWGDLSGVLMYRRFKGNS